MLDSSRVRAARTRTLKTALLSLCACTLTSGTIAAVAAGDSQIDFKIPAASLADALNKLGAQSGVQIVYAPDLARGLTSRALSGRLTIDVALKQLLDGTGLTFSYVNGDTVVLKQADARGQPARKERADLPVSTTAVPDTGALEEVTVSAQRRGDERLQDVPVPVAVLDADALARNREVMLRDYYTSIPNLSVNPQLAGGQGISLRGITTGGLGAPTVGFVIDDVPFGSSISFCGSLLPDIDPGDLARLEVLRGPQGTLYGARAMGG